MLIGNYYIGVNVKETMYVGYKSHIPNGIIYVGITGRETM